MGDGRGREMREHVAIRQLAISPDGLCAASYSGGGIRTWDLRSGQQLAPTCSYFSGEKWVFHRSVSLSFTADSKAILIGTDGRDVALWDAASGKEGAVFVPRDAKVQAVACSPDGRYAVTAEYGTLRLWDMKTCKESRILAKNPSNIYAVAFSADSNQVVSAGWGSPVPGADHSIRLWDIETGNCVATFPGHKNGTTAIAVSLNGQFVLSGGGDGLVKLWEVATGKTIQTFKVGLEQYNAPTHEIIAVAFAAQDHQLLALARDQHPQLFDLASGHAVRTFLAGMDSVTVRQAQVLPGGHDAVFAVDACLLLYDLTTGKELRKFGNEPLPPRPPSAGVRE
jgi:WD40 repeat protein